jgi:hypothetical protein
MLKNSESMLVDRNRDRNIGKLRWKMTVCGKMAMPKAASFGPFSANRTRQSRLPSFVLQPCDTNLISPKHTSATRLWSTSQMIVLGDAAACYALQSMSLRPLSANLQSTTLHASTA